ncbi:hypothetical protein TKK_0016542 [Trichogramma kaykai]
MKTAPYLPRHSLYTPRMAPSSIVMANGRSTWTSAFVVPCAGRSFVLASRIQSLERTCLHTLVGCQTYRLKSWARAKIQGQRKYAPYDFELTAIFLAIRHFHHELEGREFPVYCDHEPLQYAFSQAPEHAPLVRQRQLAYISQYTTCIKYLPGAENLVSDALFRVSNAETPSSHSLDALQVDSIALPTTFSLEKLSEKQSKD